ncbi:MAG TPA: transcriptional regulator [candidate division Zixibacteria bacterium]|nr:transcriptional regulator [candidate division Zixibacteria bacterium]
MAKMENRLLSVDEGGKYLCVNHASVSRRMVTKSVPANRMGHLREFKEDEVDEWVKAGGAVDLKKKDLKE